MSFIANIIFINMSTSLRWNPPFHEFPQIFQQDGAPKHSLDSVELPNMVVAEFYGLWKI